MAFCCRRSRFFRRCCIRRDCSAMKARPPMASAVPLTLAEFFPIFVPSTRSAQSLDCRAASFSRPILLFEPLILRQLKGVLPPLVLVPRGKIPLLHLDTAAVDGQDVIHAAVQKGAVVGHQQEALFAAEIAAHQRPPHLIQMVGGLVDEKKAVFPGKEHGQQELGLLAAGQRGKGTVQCVLRHLQRRQLPQEPPRSHVGADALQQLHGAQRPDPPRRRENSRSPRWRVLCLDRDTFPLRAAAAWFCLARCGLSAPAASRYPAES